MRVPNTHGLDCKIRKGKRKLARSVKGSRGRGRLRVAIARTEAKQSDIRQDFNHPIRSSSNIP